MKSLFTFDSAALTAVIFVALTIGYVIGAIHVLSSVKRQPTSITGVRG